MIKSKDFFVLIIGRPNVGKSTIFNKITGKTSALSSKIAGTTLDLNIKKISFNGTDFFISDSGGFNVSPANETEKKIRDKVFEYSKKAGLVLFTVDYKSGFLPEDREIFKRLKKNGSNIILVINKVDSPRDANGAESEFIGLGIKTALTVSAEKGTGIYEILEKIAEEINIKKPVKPQKTDEESGKSFKIAIIGRPNSGKSTYINTLLKEDLLFTDDKPGTTRDSIDTYIRYKERSITLVDTAGIRKKNKLDLNSEAFQKQSLNQIKRADVIVLFMDVNSDVTHEDLSLLRRITLEKKTVIIAFTKWDLKEKLPENAVQLKNEIKYKLKEFSGIPFVYISSKTNKNLNKILDMSIEIFDSKSVKIKKKDLNRFIETAKAEPRSGRIYKYISYGVQKEGEEIPTFIFFTGNKGKIFTMTDIKFLRNSIKETFGIKSNVEVVMEYKKYDAD